MQKEHYKNIDILRCIAVFLVVLHHLNFSFFNGGFIGVDIFFVISGFLITLGILKQKDSFNLLNFYQRRAYRLMPAFFTVVITNIIVFYIVLDKNSYVDFIKTVISSITFSSNIYFWYNLNGYFNLNSHLTPLLHLWSLSLEEQFYILWSIFFFINKNISKKILYTIFILITLINLYYSQFLAKNYPLAAYYLIFSRVFEFTIGGILAFHNNNKKYLSTINSLILTTIALIIFSIYTYKLNSNSLFPGFNALIICLTTAIYIHSSKRLFDSSFWLPLRYLGKISYPIYLWHWPIISYLYFFNIKLNLITSIFVIILTLSLSIITYELVEKKSFNTFKYKKDIIKKVYILPSLIIILFCLFILNFTNKPITQPINKNIDDNIKCIDSSHPNQDCVLGVKNNDKIDILLVGDSHANAQSGFIDALAKNKNLKGYEVTYSSTAFLIGVDRYTFNHRSKNYIKADIQNSSSQLIQDMIKKNHYKFVIMGGFYPHNFERNIYTTQGNNISTLESHKNFVLGLENSIKFIKNNHSIPVIINDNPILQNINPNCNLIIKDPEKNCFQSKEIYLKDTQQWNNDLKYLKIKYPKIIVIDFNNIICKNNKCYSFINNTPLYRDNQHLTYSGSYQIGIEYLKKYPNPLTELNK
ncbi:acyltransferase family protein [Acinetobacter brisouii]|uniref:acyltransferase family protein n=1 Tax=Acinetobacter brisouii TaxID=396323 RepID=UPI0035B0DE1F